ncbi:MAG TPA: tetratricopeptide repeat protein [Hyphomicrobium sp.]|nr:tetratricopeptide repeat protein [Hyphomicrobium sp.]
MNRHQRRAQPKQSGAPATRQLNALGQREFEGAVQLMKEGRWPASEAAHKRVLIHNSRHSPTLHHLGLIAFKSGQARDAIDALRLALEVEPNYTEARLNLAVILKLQGELADALTECTAVTRADPKNAAAHIELGNILKDMGRHGDAVSAYRNSLRLTPSAASAEKGLAHCLVEFGQPAEAVAFCDRVLAREPNHTITRKLKIRALASLGRLEDLDRTIDDAADGMTGRCELLCDAAIGLHKSGQSLQAVDVLRSAIARHPDSVDLHILLGTTLYDIGRLAEAFDVLKVGLDRDPKRAEGYVTLGFVLFQQGATEGAITALRHATELKPDLTAAHFALGSVLGAAGQFDGAQRAFEAALRCNPRALDARLALTDIRRKICDWDGLDKEERQCIAEIQVSSITVTPFLLLGMDASNDDMRMCGQRYARQMASKVPLHAARKLYQNYVKSSDRIRIGYLSSDYGHHATSMLLAEVLEMHDRSRFEVFGYCHSPPDDSLLRHRVTAAFDHFVSVSDFGHYASAERIRADGIEILVDLKGYTRGARQEILALRPAPVQVSYLGYPGTTGAEYLDYVVADAVVAPMEHQPHYSERIVHLGTCYQPNDRQRQIDTRPVTRADCGLPDEGFVFCSFNNTFKLNRTFFAVWMDLLQKVPDSVLWLLQKTPEVRTNLRREAIAHGVNPARIVFAEQMPNDQHLARHAAADLFLDSLPCTAHTTASDSLWAGLPLLTCLGRTFAGRVAASVLTSAGLPELIAQSVDEYAAMALRLAQNPDEISALKTKLIANRATAPLFDTPNYVRALEHAFARMSDRHRSGLTPQNFSITDAA